LGGDDDEFNGFKALIGSEEGRVFNPRRLRIWSFRLTRNMESSRRRSLGIQVHLKPKQLLFRDEWIDLVVRPNRSLEEIDVLGFAALLKQSRGSRRRATAAVVVVSIILAWFH